MEKIFHARWWDYSKKKWNINGRVCLQNLLFFGFASVVIVFLINPWMIEKINMIPVIVQYILLGILLFIHLVDNIVSYSIILNLKRVSSEIKDNTIEISEKVQSIIHQKSIFHRRLVNAFPAIQEKVAYKKWEIKERLEKLKKNR